MSLKKWLLIFTLLALLSAACSAEAEPTGISDLMPNPTASPQRQPFSSPVGALLLQGTQNPGTPTPAPKSPTPVIVRTQAPLPTSSSSTGCHQTMGTIYKGSLDTDLLRMPLQFRVYTPPCYLDDPERRFPVLYLFHGQGSTDDQWDRMGADTTADDLIAAGETAPFLIVMPYERYGGQPTETKFSQALVEVLLPHIDDAYRTLPERKYRAVGGLSRGAGWAVHFGIAHWQLFGKIGAHSPAVFHTDAQRMRSRLDQIPEDQYPPIYIDIGDKDRPEITRSTLWFEALLNEYDLPHEWHLFSGYHTEEYWRSHLEQYLRWYAQNW